MKEKVWVTSFRSKYDDRDTSVLGVEIDINEARRKAQAHWEKGSHPVEENLMIRWTRRDLTLGWTVLGEYSLHEFEVPEGWFHCCGQ